MFSSTFPNALDVITEFIDVAEGDATKITGFQQAMKDGNFTLANDYLTSITNYNKKIITATRLNQMRDAILSIEQFYITDIAPYLSTKQAEWQAIIDKFSYIGVYSPTTIYYKNNMVLYTIDSISKIYICTNTTTAGILPTNTSYFRVFTIVGKDGNSGGLIDTTFAFSWKASTNYGTNLIVVHNNKWWLSKIANVNQEPIIGSSYWEVVLDAPTPIIPIQETAPTTINVGQLWFKTIS